MEILLLAEFLVEISASICFLILSILMFVLPKIKNIRSIFYIRISLFFFGLVKLFDGFATLNNDLLGRVCGVMIFPTVLFAIIGINLTIKDSANSFIFYIVFGLGILLLYISIQPEATIRVTTFNYQVVKSFGLFRFIMYLFLFLFICYILFWGIKTSLNAPFLIKKEANIFLIGTILSSIFGFLFQYLIDISPIFVYFTNIFVSLGIIIIIYAIIKEPKLLYVLPFTIYRLLVKNKEGYPLYDHDWSESNLNEKAFTGFLNTVQVMSEEIMNIGSLVDIQLDEGIVILNKSEYITIGLVASKSSKLLRNAVANFAKDFENKFERLLKKSCIDMNEYQTAYELIEKYFSNFPYRIVKDKKHPLLLSHKKLKLPHHIEKKYKDIFTEKYEYEDTQTDLAKSPSSLSTEFLGFYNENIDEIEVLDNEIKELDDMKIKNNKKLI